MELVDDLTEIEFVNSESLKELDELLLTIINYIKDNYKPLHAEVNSVKMITTHLTDCKNGELKGFVFDEVKINAELFNQRKECALTYLEGFIIMLRTGDPVHVKPVE